MDDFEQTYNLFLKDVDGSNDLDQDFIDFVNDVGISVYKTGHEIDIWCE